MFLASGLLGLAASRGHNARAPVKPKAEPDKPTEDTPLNTTQRSDDTEGLFDGPLGFLVN
jgi:hypothetical protein